MPLNYTAVICGMGTATILSILNTDKLCKIDKLIIQSNNDLYNLRKKICKKGFNIINEVIVKERGIYYIIIKFTLYYYSPPIFIFYFINWTWHWW